MVLSSQVLLVVMLGRVVRSQLRGKERGGGPEEKGWLCELLAAFPVMIEKREQGGRESNVFQLL